jgi:hypothetical protein
MIFGCMIINGALLLLVRSVGTAFLALLGRRYIATYYVSDMMLYFVYKAFRQDVWHWVPLEGVAGVVFSVFQRAVCKVLVDFTGVVQFRGAGEMGGCYWIFNTVRASEERATVTYLPLAYSLLRAQTLSLVASFVATRVYYASLEEAEDAVMEESVAWTIVGGLSGLGASFFACFLLLMKPAYRSTFFSTQTGFQYVQGKFLREGDENKKAVFKYVRAQRAQKKRSAPPTPFQRVSPTLTLLHSQVQQEAVAVDPPGREGLDNGELGALGGGET